jgi:hypothetical protein
MSPKKPTKFLQIDAIKRYVFCSSFDDLFAYGEDGMVQVDFIDYGLEWAKLKTGQVGDTYCFEITDFEVKCPNEMLRLQARWDKYEKKRLAAEAIEKARKKMAARIKRIILGGYSKKYYWLPSLSHGRCVLAISSIYGANVFSSMSARMGVYLFSLAFTYCLRLSESS